MIGGGGETYSPSREEAIKYSILFQLLGMPVAHENWINKAREMHRTTEKILDVAIGDEKVEKNGYGIQKLGKYGRIPKYCRPSTG